MFCQPIGNKHTNPDTAQKPPDQPPTGSFGLGKKENPLGKRHFSVGEREITLGKRYFSVGKIEISVGKRLFSVGKREFSVGKKHFSVGEREIPAGKKHFSVGKKLFSQLKRGRFQRKKHGKPAKINVLAGKSKK